MCQLNVAVGKCFANAANILIEEFGKPDLIASHGQTVYHYPFDEKLDNISLKSTLQIGESSVIAEDTGCMVISNFRERDIAAGGQGAPLVCFADEKWFKNFLEKNTIKMAKLLQAVISVKVGLTVFCKMNITTLTHQKRQVESIFLQNTLKIF